MLMSYQLAGGSDGFGFIQAHSEQHCSNHGNHGNHGNQATSSQYKPAHNNLAVYLKRN